MPIYNAPVRDMQFILHDVLDVSKSGLPGHDELDRDFTEAVLDAAGKLATDVLVPLNLSGDQEGCVLENGVVRTPTGFKEAYKTYTDGGWTALSADPAYGGMGMPHLVNFVFMEMVCPEISCVHFPS